MRMKLYAGVAFAALLVPGAAFAQSTGSIDFENEGEIVVTGARTNDAGGIEVPDTSKAKAVLNQEFISRQAPGQTINDTINNLPGVSFQNNDPFGSAGGTLTIRGFDSTRISQTFDGVPLNDSGNYAIYSNQQLDPELIEQVNVNLGTTDVDSPTAGATGSTVNYRTIVPSKDFSVKVVGSRGDFDYFRTFGLIQTGEIFDGGPRMFFAASQARNNVVFNNVGKIRKQQYNARIWQDLGTNGDFISVSGHYNVNRNNFQGSLPLRYDTTIQTVSGTSPNQTIATAPRVLGSGSANRFLIGNEDPRYSVGVGDANYTNGRCLTNQVARAGVADTANSCGSTFDERFNPSNTGNFRGASRFSITDSVVLTVDPSYQFVKANGGGTVVAQEALRDVNPALLNPALPSSSTNPANSNCNTTGNSPTTSCQSGYIGGVPYFGRDLNGDGDTLDTIRVLAPSQTGTKRIGVIAGLRWNLNDDNTFRLNYTYDRARHRQTGEVGFLFADGKPRDVFPINSPAVDVGGNVLQKRDRLSYAILHQVSGEYRGEFFDNNLVVNLGIRAPFFKRNLTNYCATSSAAGFVECFGTNTAAQSAYLSTNPTVTIAPGTTAPIQGPQQRIFNYKKILPNVGLTYNLTNQFSTFFNYSKGLQVPGTDNLYNSFFFPLTTAQARPRPETTDNFDGGLRFRSSKIQAQFTGWYTDYKDRLASSYDPDLDRTVYRNLGRVKKFGFDGSIAYQPIREFSVYAFGSYLDSKIQDNVLIGRTTVAGPLGAAGTAYYANTAGKREGGSPTYTFGGGANAILGPVELGFTAKRTGPRYIYDTNEVVRQALTVNGVVQTFQIYDNKTPAYTLVDANARVGLEWAGLNKETYFQFNLINVFDEKYVGGFQSNLNQGPTFNTAGTITNYGSPPNAQLGNPRTFIASLIVGF
ncbi:TonB-dependent receptor [Sphingomonas donggukensis]|uniref:TonB-dependent receptor n=1 Tax=Sphingomonas donggukensis TaxID=2949093 RepID=A0ABY4TTL0_9SPHN|nr:TonB-dependent receptor [Sphingomonas donggukensis]URW75175.1 TonB-dependent receptor [Sphingomonas donggukensis]